MTATENGKEFLPLDVLCGLLPGSGAVRPVASPLAAVSELSGVNVQLVGVSNSCVYDVYMCFV